MGELFPGGGWIDQLVHPWWRDGAGARGAIAETSTRARRPRKLPLRRLFASAEFTTLSRPVGGGGTRGGLPCPRLLPPSHLGHINPGPRRDTTSRNGCVRRFHTASFINRKLATASAILGYKERWRVLFEKGLRVTYYVTVCVCVEHFNSYLNLYFRLGCVPS